MSKLTEFLNLPELGCLPFDQEYKGIDLGDIEPSDDFRDRLEQIKAQNGTCAICGGPLDLEGLCIDVDCPMYAATIIDVTPVE